MIRIFCIILISALSISSCTTQNVLLNEWVLEESKVVARDTYHESNSQLHDLIHTELHLNFNWNKSQIIGRATLSLKPFFYPSNEVVLDAKNMVIEHIYLESDSMDLSYTYDNQKLCISLPKFYLKGEPFSITIEYSAAPGNTQIQEGAAITDSKGLYFINPSKDPEGFMPQIWSQGEPESNSMWFPTIDSPNQKMTQDIYLTVEDKYTTLSNGVLISSKNNKNGNRTDHWRQSKNASPYLTMITIGEFGKVKDKWRDIDVDYYLEKEHINRAKEIFGNTPEMLEYFSNILGVDYPWDKYSQIVVREFVSGAMENTSAVVFGDFMYDTKEKLKGKDHEDVVAHELFHHWFGDLVTCESWSNLPLNESFATYGEYLWKEYKYGQVAADYHLFLDLQSYLREAKYKKEDLIRFDHINILDMFDHHSYAKGGRILHMLRNQIGDKAFFEGLHYYLEKNAFQTVEIHDLRLAMEKVCGRDLNWFFNQWFLAAGHPELEISYKYTNKLLQIEIEQSQNLSKFPLYKLPTSIQIHTNGKVRREYITIDEKQSTFEFEVDTKPDFVDFDPDRILLASIVDNKNPSELFQQFTQSSRFQAKLDAFTKLNSQSSIYKDKVIKAALKDPFWYFRLASIQELIKAENRTKTKFRATIEELVQIEKHPAVLEKMEKFLNN